VHLSTPIPLPSYLGAGDQRLEAIDAEIGRLLGDARNQVRQREERQQQQEEPQQEQDSSTEEGYRPTFVSARLGIEIRSAAGSLGTYMRSLYEVREGEHIFSLAISLYVIHGW